MGEPAHLGLSTVGTAFTLAPHTAYNTVRYGNMYGAFEDEIYIRRAQTQRRPAVGDLAKEPAARIWL